MRRKGLPGNTVACPSIKHVGKRCLLVLSFAVAHWRHTRNRRTWEKLFFVFLEGSLQGLEHLQTSCDIYPAHISAKMSMVLGIPMDGLPWEAHCVPAVEAFSFTPILISRSLRAPYYSCPVRLYGIFRLQWLLKLADWEGGSVTAARGTSWKDDLSPSSWLLTILDTFTRHRVSWRREKTDS